MSGARLFNRRSKAPIYLAGAVLILCVAFLDWWTGPEVYMAFLYIIPVTVVAWGAGRDPGFWTACFSVLFALGVELGWRRHYSHPFAPYFSALLLLGLALYSAAVTAAIAERERELREETAVRKEAEAKLNTANETLELRVAERSAAAEKRAGDLARSEEALRHQTSVLKSILTSIGDAVVVADRSGGVRLFNPAAARLLEIKAGKNGVADWSDLSQVLLPEALAAYTGVENALRQSLHGEVIDGLELRKELNDEGGGGGWLRMTARPLLDAGGTLQGAVFVFSDITSRKEMDKVVADVSEREQQRIGQDLHDGLGQHLVSTAFGASMLRDKLARKGLPEEREAVELVDLLHSAITQSRDLARGLFPVKLEEEGLSSALEELARNVSRNSSVACRVRAGPPVPVYDTLVGSNLYRLAQEAVNNALRHAQPENIVIRLEQSGERATLTVANDGKPFAPPQGQHQGMGLRIMNYRARMIGAELKIRPAPEGGAVVECSVPNRKPAKDLYVNGRPW